MVPTGAGLQVKVRHVAAALNGPGGALPGCVPPPRPGLLTAMLGAMAAVTAQIYLLRSNASHDSDPGRIQRGHIDSGVARKTDLAG